MNTWHNMRTGESKNEADEKTTVYFETKKVKKFKTTKTMKINDNTFKKHNGTGLQFFD